MKVEVTMTVRGVVDIDDQNSPKDAFDQASHFIQELKNGDYNAELDEVVSMNWKVLGEE